MPNANILFQNAPTPSLGANFRDAMGTQQAFNEVLQTPMQNRLLDAQVQGAEIGNQHQLLNQKIAQQGLDQKTALFQLGDMARDALAIKPLIQSGNTAETLKALEMRANKIKQRGGDPSDTIDFMQRIMGGQLSGEQAIQELDSVIDGAVRSGAIEADPMAGMSQAKVGRYRTFTTPDGSTHQYDSATGESSPLFESKPLDLSVLPEEIRAAVKGQPREIQMKVLESYTGSDKFLTTKRDEQAEQTTLSSTAKLFADTFKDPEISSATGVAGAIEGSVGRLTGSRAGVLKGRLSRLGAKLTLQAAQSLSGAMSDGDIKLLDTTKPEGSDDIALWKDWYDNEYIPIVKAAAQKKGIDFASMGIPESIDFEQPKPKGDTPTINDLVNKYGD